MMNTSSSMKKLPTRNEFTVLPQAAGSPEESKSQSPTQVENTVKEHNQGQDKWTYPEIAGEVLKYCIQIGVTITVLIFQFKGWPQEPDVYNTDDPLETSRGGETYTCGCRLPASLGLGAVHEDLAANSSLNICYEKSGLDTVTILMYSNSAAAKIERIFADVEPDILKKIYNLAVPGYKVTQDAYDLYGSIDKDNPGFYGDATVDLQPLFIGGRPQLNTLVAIDEDMWDTVQKNFMSFSIQSYVRLYFRYYCNSCGDCAPDLVNDVWNEISIKKDWWASCFFQDIDIDEEQRNSSKGTCNPDRTWPNVTFWGRCNVYPSVMLPPNNAISKFLKEIGKKHGNLIADNNSYLRLEPSLLYLNVSQVQSSSIQLNFVEVIKNSALWVSLLSFFSTLDNECANMDRVQVCNGTSVCNMFPNTNSDLESYDLRCLHMNNRAQCKQLLTAGNRSSNLVGNSTYDNTARWDLWSRLNVTSWSDLECPEFICEKVHPYFVMWNKSSEMENDASLNQFLSRWILDDSWAQLSGVCTTTYSDVYRYPRATPGAHDNGTMFLQTECTNISSSWANPDGYCWLTGRYHNINDNPTDDWKDLGKDDPRLVKFRKRFICYKVKRKEFVPWFIATIGILFGWIGTIDFISKWLAKKIQGWIHKRKKGN